MEGKRIDREKGREAERMRGYRERGRDGEWGERGSDRDKERRGGRESEGITGMMKRGKERWVKGERWKKTQTETQRE